MKLTNSQGIKAQKKREKRRIPFNEILLVKSMLEDSEYFSMISPVLKKAYISSPAAVDIFEACKAYYQAYKELPGQDVILNEIRDEDRQEDAKGFLNEVNALKFNPREQWDYLMDKTTDWIEEKAQKQGMLKAINFIDGGQRKEAYDAIDESKLITLRGADLENYFKHVRTGNDIQQMDIPPIRWMIGNNGNKFLTEGLTLLAGKPKKGKSTLCFNLTLELSIGREFILDRFPGKQMDVLYIALEDNDRRIKANIQKRMPGGDLPRAHFVYEWRPIGEGFEEDLDAWMKYKPETRVVIIDVLEKVCGEFTRQKKRGIYSGDYHKLSSLHRLATKHRISIIAVHHLNKREGEDIDPQDLISGSTGLAGAADTVMVFQRKPKQSDVNLYVAGRDVGEFEYRLGFDWTDISYSCLGETKEFELPPVKQEYLDEIRKHGSVTIQDLYEQFTDRSEPSVRKTISELKRDGYLLHDDKKYSVNPERS